MTAPRNEAERFSSDLYTISFVNRFDKRKLNDRNGSFDTTCTGKSNNVRHVNTVNSAQFVIENVKPCMRICVV